MHVLRGFHWPDQIGSSKERERNYEMKKKKNKKTKKKQKQKQKPKFHTSYNKQSFLSLRAVWVALH